MSNLDGLVSMHCGFFMFMDLGQKGTYLHMRFTLVFEHLKLEGGLTWIIEEVLDKL